MAKKNLSKDFIDIGVATVIGGASIGLIQSSNIPPAFKTGTSILIGAGLLKGGINLLK